MIKHEDGLDAVALHGDSGKVAQGTGYVLYVSDDLEVSGAVAALSELMEMLSTHPKISPVELQGAVMGAMMGGGSV